MWWITFWRHVLRAASSAPPTRPADHEAETQRRLGRLYQRYQAGYVPECQAARLVYAITTETTTEEHP
jgi:hypothetical protein